MKVFDNSRRVATPVRRIILPVGTWKLHPCVGLHVRGAVTTTATPGPNGSRVSIAHAAFPSPLWTPPEPFQRKYDFMPGECPIEFLIRPAPRWLSNGHCNRRLNNTRTRLVFYVVTLHYATVFLAKTACGRGSCFVKCTVKFDAFGWTITGKSAIAVDTGWIEVSHSFTVIEKVRILCWELLTLEALPAWCNHRFRMKC